MVTVDCKACGKAIETYPSRKSRRKYCNRECYAKALSRDNRGSAHPMFGKRHSLASIEKMKASQAGVDRTGANAASWKGGRFLTSKGYVMLSVSGLSEKDRALAIPMLTKNRDYVPEHRLVMARKLGRPLTRQEIPHHKNGIKGDNRPRNLEMEDNATHKMTHQSVVRELRRLRHENEGLKLQLSKFLNPTSRAAG